jgi:site-specific DNA-methyltransferase (adenine-specific)
MPKIELFNEDCMAVMARYPDKHFELAIIDPPYGIGEDGKSNHSRSKLAVATQYAPKNWDKSPPDKAYFDELKRVSKNQIIWGANHFISRIPVDSSCWIIWDKQRSGDFADCELAWTSFKTAVRLFTYRWNGFQQGPTGRPIEKRIHPTQKPVKLYEWLLHNYAKPGQRILDTHLGSGSSAIAAHYYGVEFVGSELDTEYYDAAVKRFALATAQTTLFEASA